MKKLVAFAALAAAMLLSTAHDAGAAGPDSEGRIPVNSFGRTPDGGKVQFAAEPDGRQIISAVASGLPVRAVVEVCSSYAQAVQAVGVAAVAVPVSALAGRKLVRVCNSPENVGSPKVKCLLGGTAPVLGATNPGDVLTVGDCFPYQVDSTVALKCISDTAGTAVTTFECAW